MAPPPPPPEVGTAFLRDFLLLDCAKSNAKHLEAVSIQSLGQFSIMRSCRVFSINRSLSSGDRIQGLVLGVSV